MATTTKVAETKTTKLVKDFKLPKMWLVHMANPKTSERKLSDPTFLVVAETWEEAHQLVEKNLDRDEWPAETHELMSDIVEFGEMGPNVAWL